MNILRRNPSSSKRKSTDSIVGTIVIGLAVVGIIAIAVWTYGFVADMLDDSDQMEGYESFLLPVVMMDPVPFNNILNMEDQFILQTALWASLLGENRANYSYDENGILLIPATELDVSAVKLFGDTVVLNHRTFDDYDASYLYDPTIEAYRVPIIAKVAYSPNVEHAQTNGNKVTLRVGYIPPGNIWSSEMQANKQEGEATAEKYMLYDLEKATNGEGYYIKAVRDVPAANSIATSS